MFRKIIFFILLFLILTPILLIYCGNVESPQINVPRLSEKDILRQSHFYPKNESGVHQIFLQGNDFERGQQYGFWTRDLLFKQEKALLRKLDELIPSTSLQYGLFLLSMGWFNGLEKYYKKSWLEEMYGVSFYGSKENKFFATPFTRQMAYHGIHDMGQMMIDHGLVLGACTQAAVPLKGGWLIGRNFDFEAGPVFDEDKILKWVFPETGYPFVSIIFSGMVGVVSGINQNGVYIGLNAAGSDDFTRLGTPTSLVVLDALQFSNDAKEAVEIIKNASPLITDIYIVADKGDKLYIVEKSPEKWKVIEKVEKAVVTNHLQHSDWSDDQTNRGRMLNNTTLTRFNRGSELIQKVDSESSMLNLLRDKLTFEGGMAFTHRGSIDALIASHSIIYNSKMDRLFVSKGPGLSEEYIGVDLKKSFKEKKPTLLPSLPADQSFHDRDYYKIKKASRNLEKSKKLSLKGQCKKANELFKSVSKGLFQSHYNFYWALGELQACLKEYPEAKRSLKKSLSLQPAYRNERLKIENRIKTL